MTTSIIETLADLTPAVLRAMSAADNPRLRTVIAALVGHIHAFAREVTLTEAEYDLGIDFLNRIGQATHDRHNEGILFADVIGLSTLVCLLNTGNASATGTAAALLGPFWRANSPRTENGGSIIRSPTPGAELFASGEIVDVAGKPLAGVEVDVWHSSPIGLYENQDDSQAPMNMRGKFTTDAAGRFSFRSVKPAGYPVPTDGPVGDLLRAQNRAAHRPAHIHFLAFKPGYKTLITQVFADKDEHLESDMVFGVTRALVAEYRRHDHGEPPAAGVQAPWYRLHYRFVMEAGEATLPKPPIK